MLAHDDVAPAVPPSRSIELEANGARQRVLEWTRENAIASTAAMPVAWFLHGYMDAAGSCDRLAPLLASGGLRVLAPELRGFGAGPRVAPGGYYHFPDYVADVASLVAELVPVDTPIFLVGHSMGGTIATLFAGAFPERVTKLALLEGVGPPDNPEDAAPLRMRAWIEGVNAVRAGARSRGGSREGRPLSREDALRRLVVHHPRVPRDVLGTRLPHLLAADEKPGEGAGEGAGEVTTLAATGVQWAFDPLHRTTAPIPFRAATYRVFARRIACPVLYVSGGDDGFGPPDLDERLAAFSEARRVDVGGGHMMHWTRPSALADALLDFWQRRAEAR